MTILQALDRYYDRMAERGEAEDLGFTRENIGYALSIGRDGSIRGVLDLRIKSGQKVKPVRMSVPRPKRTSNIQANFLWDKTAYAFGVDSGKSKRLSEEHAAFKAFHREMLADASDEHAEALLAFIDRWTPDKFNSAPFGQDMLDASFVFRLEDEQAYLHEVSSLREKWLSSLDVSGAPIGLCLVTGRRGPLETGHPIVKAVNGAQTSGAYLVSFNADAYTSYGKPKDATNAPTSKTAAARYGAALNGLLERSGRNRLQRGIGDATVVFWAETSKTISEEAAVAAEDVFAAVFDPVSASGRTDADDASEAVKLRDALEAVSAGRPKEVNPRLEPSTRFHVLGLAPNAARLSVRYWLTDDFEAFASRLLAHYLDLSIEPEPRGWGEAPAINRLLMKTTALQEKFDNIPPLLAGEVTRAVLTGMPYPRTLLVTAIIRLRAGDDPSSGWHAAIIRACVNRSLRFAHSSGANGAGSRPSEQDWTQTKKELPVALDPNREDDAYQLGRLFAMLEAAQYAALKRVNAPIGDRYYGAASATPARVFGPLMRGLKHHLADARKRGRGAWIEERVGEIISRLPPDLPRVLRLEDQGRFAVGYYHEKARPWGKTDGKTEDQRSEEEGNNDE